MDIIIPELDEIYDRNSFKRWTDDELSILDKYYGHVDFKILMKYFPGRTPNAVRCKAKSRNYE